jgi:outer membrane protein assembly factor BamE (lipoprotein component of BamABCDE complex)
MNKLILIVLGLALSACSSMPKLKDLNKIDAGMSKEQVIDILGEPTEKKFEGNRELYEYAVDFDGTQKPRLIVFEDNEVVFSGRPADYKAQVEREASKNGGASNTNTVTVNPSINVNPIFNVGGGSTGSDFRAPASIQKPAGNGSYFHEHPTVGGSNE